MSWVSGRFFNRSMSKLKSSTLLRLFLLPLPLAFVVAGGISVVAATPQKQALDALRAKGDYSAAVDYLQRLRSTAGLPQEFAETIDYELAVTHIDAAGQASRASATNTTNLPRKP